MLKALESKRQRANEIQGLLADPEVLKDRLRYQNLAKELARLSPLLKKYDEYLKSQQDIRHTQELLEGAHDKDLHEMAHAELATLQDRLRSLQIDLENMVLEDDPDADRNIIMEIRAGTGGVEATLFAAELFRMYSKYAQRNKFKIDVMNTSPSEQGGVKEVIFSVEGPSVFGSLRYESGVHRVQRVPTTEASGRIHTSAVTVAVLPEAQEVDIKIDPKDIRVDVYRASGHGGQSVNTTDSAVRITYIPYDIVVTCQDERSQLKNKLKAMKVLRSRLLDKARQDHCDKISQSRKSQVGTGDRSEKIRTYNFPDGRVTDHRIGLTLYKVESIMEGDIDEILSALKEADKKSRLESLK